MYSSKKLSAQKLVETMAVLFQASTHYSDLQESLNVIEVSTFTSIDEPTIAKIYDDIQSSIFSFFVEAGSLLAENYAFDPFLNINLSNSLCSETHVPFAVAILFGKSDSCEPSGSVAMGFCLRINEGHISILCE